MLGHLINDMETHIRLVYQVVASDADSRRQTELCFMTKAGAGSVPVYINWGDGSAGETVLATENRRTENSPSGGTVVRHLYTGSGEYIIDITSRGPLWAFQNVWSFGEGRGNPMLKAILICKSKTIECLVRAFPLGTSATNGRLDTIQATFSATDLPRCADMRGIFIGHEHNATLPAGFCEDWRQVLYADQAFDHWGNYNTPAPRGFLRNTPNLLTAASILRGWAVYNQALPAGMLCSFHHQLRDISSACFGWAAFNQARPEQFLRRLPALRTAASAYAGNTAYTRGPQYPDMTLLPRGAMPNVSNMFNGNALMTGGAQSFVDAYPGSWTAASPEIACVFAGCTSLVDYATIDNAWACR